MTARRPLPGRAAASSRRRSSPAPAARAKWWRPAAVRPMDPMVAARFVLDGMLHNDLYIVAEPEYRAGVEARCNALLESMEPFKPLPAVLMGDHLYRTPIYRQEIAHRKATQTRQSAVLRRAGSMKEDGHFVARFQVAEVPLIWRVCVALRCAISWRWVVVDADDRPWGPLAAA